MAFSLRSSLPFSPQPHRSTSSTRPVIQTRTTLTVRCGPLHKGRMLSIEAIQAVQALKRAHHTDDDGVSKTLSRLVKADLVKAFNELLRQDHCQLALKVFSAIRTEEWYKVDLNLYANLVAALARKGLSDDIDRLIFDLEVNHEDEDIFGGKGLTTLIKALIAAERGEATVRIYRMMKRSGWSCRSAAEDYVGKVLSRGLKRLGEVNVASEIDMELGRMSGGILEKV